MTTNNPLRVRDYSLLIPLSIGIFSLLGICLLLGSVWFPRQKNTQGVPTQSISPLKFMLLATQSAIPEPELEITSSPEFLPAPSGTAEGDGMLVPSLTEQTEISTNGDLFTATVTITPNPIFTESVPLTVGTYDDTDLKIIRNGNWIGQNNVDAYQGALLVSNTVGNYIAFSFTGTIMALGYQSSLDAGGLTVNIDGSELTITQLVGNVWFSQESASGTHFVIITHASGASVNLDYIDIPG